MKKTNILTIILMVLVLGLSGYIVYDKVLNTKEEIPNYQDNNNVNEDDNTNKEETVDVHTLKTTKQYVGCTKDSYLTEQFGYEYAIYTLEIKENNRCVLYGGGIDATSTGSIHSEGICSNYNSYINYQIDDATILFFKKNSDNTITYQNDNVVMNEVATDFNASYNYCKNNY